MQEIKCPNCGTVFQVDESGYAQIVQQVRDKEFDRELKRREAELAEKKERDLTDKDREIDQLKAKLAAAQTERKLAVAEAVQEKEKEISAKITEITALRGQLTSKDAENKLKVQSLKEQHETELRLKDEQIEYYIEYVHRG